MERIYLFIYLISLCRWGFQAGWELTDVILILNTTAAIEVFSSQAQISLGTELGVSIGPIGR